ncbi:DDE-type integrase/transposase/recombinase [Clostridium sp. WLY-B-L2]|uniref:DDE-type integrase/transposase/recombinase n=1 Tax=Clostridium aromativorans TaxID=2836848 RepID=A0ABS8N5A8_9CLOT|nr:DDE-type integrase/transposase/recombinase [Clostridium aromativorans]MCC9294960.1 DDE-type integrase/transposase/recombinase [Clostridium aromativorans]
MVYRYYNLWTNAGFVYLASIMDLYSQKIIAWTLSKTLEVSCVIDTINKAKKNKKLVNPVIIHSDRVRQYVSKEYRKAASISYSKKAYPRDNACIESFHAIIKHEWINCFKIKNYRHAYILVFEYIETFYNTVRIHSHCNYMSSNEFEKVYRKTAKFNEPIAS